MVNYLVNYDCVVMSPVGAGIFVGEGERERIDDPLNLHTFFYAFFLYLPRLYCISLNGRLNLHTMGIAACYRNTVQRYCLFFICTNKMVFFHKNLTKCDILYSLHSPKQLFRAQGVGTLYARNTHYRIYDLRITIYDFSVNTR